MARQKQMCFASPAVGRCLSFFWCEAASTGWPSPPRLLFRGSGARYLPASLYLSRGEQSKAKRVIPGANHHFPICRGRPSCVCMSSSSLVHRITAIVLNPLGFSFSLDSPCGCSGPPVAPSWTRILRCLHLHNFFALSRKFFLLRTFLVVA